MSARLVRYLLIFALIVAVPAAFADPIIVNPNFGAVPVNCGGGLGFAYQGMGTCDTNWSQDFNSAPGFGWTLSTTHDQQWYGPGVTKPDSYFNPPPFDGLPFTQAAFLQTYTGISSSVSQNVDGFAPGDYTLSFYLGSRYAYDDGQTVQALIDGNVVGSWYLSPATPFTQRFTTFTVTTGGVHNLEFLALGDPGDNTAFLSGVNIYAGTPEPSSLMLLATGILGGLAKFYRR